jgi:site-specific DNA-cytosine methylase
VDASAWLQEPEGVPRVIKGQENRTHRLKGLGNAVVPQVVEAIGRAVMEGLNAA